MPRYSSERRQAVLEKLLPPFNRAVSEISRSEGISEQTLYNWLSKARKDGVPVPGSRSKTTDDWSAEAKFAVVLETQPLNESEKAQYCREKGLYPEQIERWQQEFINGVKSGSVDTEALRNVRNENKRLKRKIDRKDKALAESAALLVLSKKFQALLEEED